MLSVVHAEPVEVPDLPFDRLWEPATKQWWQDLWESPMAPEYDQSDIHGLHILAVLIDEFHLCEKASQKIKLASEIRQQRICFGLTPIDRRRLQWEIDRGEGAAQRTAARKEAAPKPKGKTDPRRMLA